MTRMSTAVNALLTLLQRLTKATTFRLLTFSDGDVQDATETQSAAGFARRMDSCASSHIQRASLFVSLHRLRSQILAHYQACYN